MESAGECTERARLLTTDDSLLMDVGVEGMVINSRQKGRIRWKK